MVSFVMAAEIGIASGSIAFANLTYQSLDSLYKAIKKFRGGEKTLDNLSREILIISGLLEDVQNLLGKMPDQSLSENVKKCLKNFETAMEACSQNCREFEEELNKITSNSTSDRISKRDKLKLILKEERIATFMLLMGNYKSNIGIALGLLNHYSSERNEKLLQGLELNMTTVMSGVSGQIEGVKIAIQSLVNAGISNHNVEIIETLRGHENNMKACLEMCTSAVEALPADQSASIKTMAVFDKARQLVVLTTGKSGLIGSMTARDEGRQAVYDNLKARDGDQLEVMKAFFS